ncbi:MAG: 30S ribosomal protein S17 [Lentisphaeria bacterium]
MAEAEVKKAEAEAVAGSDNCEKVERNLRKVLSGTVVGDKMDKTIIVKVDRRMTHPLYGKVVKVTKKYYAHDANNEARIGDVVKLMETRPLSKLKRWRLISIERRAVTE